MSQVITPTSVSALRQLTLSLVLIGVAVAMALVGLAADGNWPKVLRVALAFASYASVLQLLARTGSKEREEPVSFACFAGAGASAGVVSGLVRPHFDLNVFAAGTIAAALLLAGTHWLALRSSRKIFEYTIR